MFNRGKGGDGKDVKFVPNPEAEQGMNSGSGGPHMPGEGSGASTPKAPASSVNYPMREVAANQRG